MSPTIALWLWLQSGPIPPDAQVLRLLNFALLTGLLVSRLVAGPLVYMAARKRPSGREVWWGALASMVPLIGVILFLVIRGRPPEPVTGAWNPWVVCPFCQSPRGLTADPCPRCGQLLPQGSQVPGYAPPPDPRAPARRRFMATDVTGAQVIGTTLFAFVIAGIAVFALLLPALSDPVTGEFNAARLLGEPWFLLAGLVVQDSILAGIALDQAFFRKRLTLTEMGLSWEALGGNAPKNIGIGLAAGGLTFAISSLSLQILINTLQAFGVDTSGAAPVVAPRIASASDYTYWLIALCVVAPIAEEIFFRGYALSGFIKRGVTNRGLLATSALFAVVHLDPLALGPLFAAGLLLGALRIKTGSLTASLTAHATNNFIVVTLTLMGY